MMLFSKPQMSSEASTTLSQHSCLNTDSEAEAQGSQSSFAPLDHSFVGVERSRPRSPVIVGAELIV